MSGYRFFVKSYSDVREYCPDLRLSCCGCPKFDDCKVLEGVVFDDDF